MAGEFMFLELIELLKNTLRRGWVLRKVPDPESVGDHMYRMAIMCLTVKMDKETQMRAVYMALVHDMGEALVGDITPHDNVSKEDKFTQEEMALKFMACTIRSSNPEFADLILELWYEFEAGKTRAAQLVQQIDALECLHQAVVYAERTGKDLSDFMSQKQEITLPELKPLLDVCLERYEELKLRKESDIVVIFVSGGPGVGKGTQCTLLAKEFDFYHISVGDLLREEAKDPTSPYRDFIPESIKKSVLIPAQLTTQLLKREMGKAQEKGKSRFLLDGFPRNLEQATDFGLKISNRYSTLSLNCSEAELQERLGRRSKSSGRIDDNPESIAKRFETFNRNNEPVLQYLQSYGPVHTVDCRGSIDDVYAAVRTQIQDILKRQKTS